MPSKARQQRRRRSVQSEWNKNLDDAISDAIAYVKEKVDPLMDVAADGDPQMVNNYKFVRKIQIRSKGRPSDKEVAYRKSRAKKNLDL